MARRVPEAQGTLSLLSQKLAPINQRADYFLFSQHCHHLHCLYVSSLTQLEGQRDRGTVAGSAGFFLDLSKRLRQQTLAHRMEPTWWHWACSAMSLSAH